MTPERWARLKDLFNSALECDPEKREVFLQQACGQDESLRAELDSLLSAYQRTGAFPGHPFLPPSGSARTTSQLDAGASESEFLPGQLLAGRYRIIRFIGRGGMGEVYEVEDLELREHVALKIIRPEIAPEQRVIERFKREIHIARKVSHPNVCRIFDLGYHLTKGESRNSPNKIVFLTMELLPGETLAERLERTGRMTIAEALPAVRQMGAGLNAAHEAGVVHRDFKSGNVILVSENKGLAGALPYSGQPKEKPEHSPAFAGGRAVITDFGLARRSVAGERASTSLGGPGMIMGTPAYVAPEQLEGGEITPATDIYALGVVMYEMVTGACPFVGDTPWSTAHKRLKEPPPSPRMHVPTLDPVWEATILRCLERDPDNRFRSAADVVKALGGEEVAAGKRMVEAQKRRRRRLALVYAAALLLLAAAYYSLRPRLGPTSPLRRAVAVIGFKNLSNQPDVGWLSAALSDELTTELAAGKKLRVLPGEDVAEMKRDFSLSDSDGFGKETLIRIRNRVGADVVIVGSYVDLGKESGGQIRWDLRLQDTETGSTISSVSKTGTEASLFELVSGTGERLRQELGAGEETAPEAAGVRASLPSNADGARFYSEGVTRLRSFDVLAARGLLEKAVAAEPEYPLAHSALAEAWSMLGYSAKAQEQAKKAFDLSAGLPREQQLLVEGRYREITHDWEKGTQAYRALFDFFPDDLEYGLRLTGIQTLAGAPKEALKTIENLRKLPAPLGGDPRIDLAEVEAVDSLGDFKREQVGAARAVEKAKALRATLLEAKALHGEAWALQNLGELKQAAAAAAQSKKIYDSAGDEFGASRALEVSATVLLTQGDLKGAIQAYQESLAVVRRIGNKRGEATVLNQIGNVLYQHGKLAEANEMYEQVLPIMRELGNKNYTAKALSNIAGVLHDQGDLTGATKKYQESLALSREVGDKDGAGIVLVNLANAFLEEGNLGLAEKTYGESLELFRETGNKSDSTDVLLGLGDLLEVKGELAKARQEYTDALAVRKEMGERAGTAESEIRLAEISIEEGRAVYAEASLREALNVFREQTLSDDELAAHILLAKGFLSQGKTVEAQKEIDVATRLGAKSENRGARLSLAVISARVQAASAKPTELAEAARRLDAAQAEARKYGFLGYQFEARLALGEIEMKSGHGASGRAQLTALRSDAQARGYGLIGRKAAAALGGDRRL